MKTFFFGKKVRGKRLNYLSKVFLFFLISLNVFATDAGQSLPDQLEDNFYKDSGEYSVSTDSSIMDKAEEAVDQSAHFFPNIKGDGEYIGLPDHTRPKSEDVLENPSKGKYFSFREKDDVRKYGNKGKTDFSFLFLIDSFDYADRNDIFKRIFETGDEGIKGGILQFSLNKYFSRSQLFNTKIGMNFGFGFNEGNSFFVPDPNNSNVVEQSTAQVKLWTIPIELNLAIEFNLTRYLKLQASGGPSIMFLVQTRADKKESHPLEELRQIGFGYFALAAVKLSLSDIFQSSVGYRTLTTYDMSKMSLDFYMKHQNLSGFKSEDIKISGTSIGFGFSFEYL